MIYKNDFNVVGGNSKAMFQTHLKVVKIKIIKKVANFRNKISEESVI